MFIQEVTTVERVSGSMYQYYNTFLSSTCSIYLCILARKGVFLNQIRLRINHDLQLN